MSAIKIGPHTVEAARVFFSFESGRLDYDCGSCGATCCKGFGYMAVDPAEIRAQLSDRPELAVFVSRGPRAAAAMSVHNCAPGCFFLSAEGHCGVQSTQGYDAKPETCRLFPFNHFRTVGDWLVVEPHPQLCPLEVVPAERRSERSDHAVLLREMATKGIKAAVPQHISLLGNPDAQVRLEQTVIADCMAGGERAIDDLAVSQLHRGDAAFQTLRPSHRAATARTLEQLVANFNSHSAELCGIWPSAGDVDAELEVVVRACMPVFRSELVFGTEMSGRRESADELRRVSLFLLAVHKFAALAKRAGMRSVTYQTLRGIAKQRFRLLTLLSFLPFRIAWRADRGVDFSWSGAPEAHQAYLRIVKAILNTDHRKPGATFGQMLLEHTQDLGADRLAFVSCVADRLIGRVSCADSAPERRSFRAGAERTAAACPETVLLHLANRPPTRSRTIRQQAR